MAGGARASFRDAAGKELTADPAMVRLEQRSNSVGRTVRDMDIFVANTVLSDPAATGMDSTSG